MRVPMLALFATLFAVSPGVCADWSRYDNARFGYAIAVPPELFASGEADTGDGQVFRSKDGRATLTVWGNAFGGLDFAEEIAARQHADSAAGWIITSAAASPDWASYSALQGGHVLYVRAIATCGGTAIAGFRLRYPQADMAPFDAVIARLTASLSGGACQ